jgi:hypothetical protein
MFICPFVLFSWPVSLLFAYSNPSALFGFTWPRIACRATLPINDASAHPTAPRDASFAKTPTCGHPQRWHNAQRTIGEMFRLKKRSERH